MKDRHAEKTAYHVERYVGGRRGPGEWSRVAGPFDDRRLAEEAQETLAATDRGMYRIVRETEEPR